MTSTDSNSAAFHAPWIGLSLLLLSSAYCGRKAGLRAEITLNGFQLSVLYSEILHVPERFTVLGVTKILRKSILRASGDPLQVKGAMKSICVSQHRALKVLLLMWSSPAALVNVKLSANRLSTGPQSFFSPAAYHFRTTSSFVKI